MILLPTYMARRNAKIVVQEILVGYDMWMAAAVNCDMEEAGKEKGAGKLERADP